MAGCGNLGCEPNPPMRGSNCASADAGDLVHQRQRQVAAAAGKALVVLDRRHHAAADSSASSRRSCHTCAIVNNTRPNPGRP